MPNYLQPDEVKDAIPRPLMPDEERVLPNWIEQAEECVLDVVPDLDERLALAADAPRHIRQSTLKHVLTAVVERKINNPTGVRSVGLADGSSLTNDRDVSAGRIYLTDAEISRFAPRPVAAAYGDGFYSIPLGF